MPTYPYLCPNCDERFSVDKKMSESSRAESCPECETEVAEQTYAGRTMRGYVSTEGNWSSGKKVVQLHPNHPDYHVTSKKQMEDVYQRNGISLDTGHYTSKEAQVKGTVPRAQRTDKVTDDTIISGVQEEN